MENIEMHSPEELFNCPTMIGMAKGSIPLPQNFFKWDCLRCHNQTGFETSTAFFQCPYCDLKVANLTAPKNESDSGG